MRMLRLRVQGFRGIDEREVEFAPTGVTVIHGANEAGKSSLAEAIDIVLEYKDDSAAKPVKNIQPHGRDVPTEIELELETGRYHLTVTKRFHRERSTRLVVHAPAPEQHRGREAHERLRAILAETVDMPLWKALRVQQGAAPAQADLRDQTSLAAALDEAAQVALGGEHEANLVERAEEEFNRFFTATGQRNIELKRRAEIRQHADDAVAVLTERVRALEADLEHHDQLDRTIVDLDGEVARHAARVGQLEDEVKALDAERLALAGLQRIASEATLALVGAEHELEARRQLAGLVATAGEQLARLEAARAAQHDELATAQAKADVAEAAAAEALERRRQARELARLRRADASHLRDVASLDDQRRAATQMSDAQARLAEADEVARSITIDDAGLAAVEDAQQAAVVARARLEAQSPAVRIEGLGVIEVELDSQLVSLSAGTEVDRAVPESLDIVVPGAVHIRVSGGRSVETAAAELAAAEATLHGALASAGAVSLADARSLARRRSDALRLQRELRPVVRELAATALDEQSVARRADELATYVGSRPSLPPMPSDEASASKLADAAEIGADVLDRAADKAQRAETLARRELAELEAVQREVGARVAAAVDDLRSLGADLASARQARPDRMLETIALERGLAATEAAKRSTEAADRLGERQPEVVAASLNGARRALKTATASREDAGAERIRLAARITALGDEGLHDRLAAAEAEAEAAAREHLRWEREAEAARLLHTTLQRHRDNAQAAYVAPLRSRIDELGQVVFGPAFTVELGADLAVGTRTLDGVTLPVEQLSVGAQEQLAIIARLACASLVAADGGVPVVLDDALGYSDAQRLERMGAVLSSTVAGCQVIVLTCMPERYRNVEVAKLVELTQLS